MNNKKQLILEKIRSDSSLAEITAEELEKQLDDELKKPNTDYDLVDELTAAVLEARGQTVEAIDVDSEISKIKRKTVKVNRRFKCPKWAVAFSAACLFLIGANCISVAAWRMNIFSAIVEMTKGGISIDFGKQDQEVISLPTSENDLYGIKSKCAEYEIYPETPQYLPNGFELVDFQMEELDVSTDLMFFYKKGDVKLNISYEVYIDSDEIPSVGLPTDTYNLNETTINNHITYILKEDNQFTATYIYNNIVYTIFSDGLDYDECQRIIESIK